MVVRFETEVQDLAELKQKMEVEFAKFARFSGSDLAVNLALPQNIQTAPAQEAPILTATEVLESQKKPVGRPRKAVEGLGLPVDGTAKPEPKPEAKVEKPKKYTLDQVRSALQTYAQKVDPDASVGILKVRELLAQYQSTKHVPCQKISEVQDQDYAALVAACGA